MSLLLDFFHQHWTGSTSEPVDDIGGVEAAEALGVGPALATGGLD